MSRAPKILDAARRDPASIEFNDLKYLVEASGWILKRVSGDHHVFSRPNTPEIINLQPEKRDKKKAKRYQVVQVVDLIEKYAITVN